MKNFIYKMSIFVFFIFFLYEITVGREIKKIKDDLIIKFSSFEVYKKKNEIKNELINLINKDRIIDEDDAKILSTFIKKLLRELDLKN